MISLALLTSCAQEKSVDLVPQPQQVVLEKGNFTFDNNVSIVGNSQFEIDFLKGKLSASAGIALKDGQNGGKTIEINVDPSAATFNHSSPPLCRNNFNSIVIQIGKNVK
ncbi:MAG: hypothetical protein II202_05115 [Bacteroidales bacterium]|nr:hypothetical protein [Bacteroidales bacterium]